MALPYGQRASTSGTCSDFGPYKEQEEYFEDGVDALSHREVELLGYLASDDLLDTIDTAMGTTKHTTANYRLSIYRKLGVGSRCGAVVRGLQLGIITLPDTKD